MCNVFRVAFKICENSGWTITNLELQKILYIAQMFSIGQRGQPLFNETIEAWDYGPVIPDVYHKFKSFFATSIQQYAFEKLGNDLCNEDECKFIDKISEMVYGLKGWELVAITHRPGSAWSNIYRPGAKHLQISVDDMKKEYQELWSLGENGTK